MPPKLISDALASDDSAMSILREVGIDFPLYRIGNFAGTNTKWIGKIFNSTSYLYGFQQRYPDSWGLVYKIEDESRLANVAEALDTPEYSMRGVFKRLQERYDKGEVDHKPFIGIYSPRLVLIALLSGKKEPGDKLRHLFGLTLKQINVQQLLNTVEAMNATELKQRIITIEKANPKTAVKRPKYNPEEGIVYTDGSVLWKDRYAVFSVWNPTRKEAVTGKVDASVPSVQAEGMAVMLALESWAALIKIIRTDSKDLVEAVERVSPGLSSEDRNQLKVPIAADIKDEITRHNIGLEWVSRSNRELSIADRMCDEARIEGHYGHWSVTVDWDLPSTSDEFFKATPKRRKTALTAIPGGGVDPIAEAIQGLAKQEQVMVSAIAELEAKLQNLRNQLPEIEQNKRVLEQAKAVMEQVGRD